MKRLLVVLLVVFVGVLAWQVGQELDMTVVALIVGIVFGVGASIPAALLVLAAQRRAERAPDYGGGGGRGGYPARGGDYPQPIVIMPPYGGQGQQAAFPPAQPASPPWTVTGGGDFDDLPAPQQDGRFRMAR